jgi:hypothetical protein
MGLAILFEMNTALRRFRVYHNKKACSEKQALFI